MVGESPRYAIRTTLPVAYDQAIERVKVELAKEGFGVLTEINIAAALKEKLDVDFRPYMILGACNPGLAHRALGAELDIGLLLPCNVIVYEGEQEGQCIVAAMNPTEALSLTDNGAIRDIAADAEARLRRALAQLSS